MDDNGTYLGNIYGIYKACIANISIDIYDIKYCAVTKVSPIFLVPRLAHGSQYNVVNMLVFVQLPHGIRGKDV